MNLFDRKMSDFRKVITKSILDFAENDNSKIFKFLSNNQYSKNILFYLNDIRKEQRESAIKSLADKQIPENISINLNSIIFTIPLEYEDFDILKLIFSQLRADDEKTFDTIQSIFKNKENSGFRCRYNLGIIGGEKGRFSLSNIKPLKNIPKNVKNIELTYTRLMPSFAIVILKFNLLENVSNEINYLQNKEYLSTITFKKYFPLNRLIYNKIESWGQETKQAIDKYKSTIQLDIKRWVEYTFKIKNNKLENSFFMYEYQIFGNPTNEDNLKKWLKENQNWLNDFGFGYPQIFEYENFFTHYSHNAIISLEPYQIQKNGIHTRKRINDEILSMVTQKSIYSVINKYQKKIEILKTTISKDFQKPTFKILFKNYIHNSTITMTLLNRLSEELKQNEIYIKNKIFIIGTPKNIFNDKKEKNPIDTFMKNTFLRLKEIKKDLKVLNGGLNNILSTANTKAILYLTIIMAILTSLSVYEIIFNKVTSTNTTKVIEREK